MPDANGNPVIGDLITAEINATTTQANASAAAAVADKALSDANAAKASADSALAGGLKNFPNGVFTIDTTGRVTVYLADSSPAGFHPIEPAPVTAPLPPAPAPAPAPTPGPSPTPAS